MVCCHAANLSNYLANNYGMVTLIIGAWQALIVAGEQRAKKEAK